MVSPFSQAWKILKYFKNPHDEEAGVNPSFKEKYPNYDLRNLFANPRNQPTEEETYGGISHREHPLHNVEQEREMAEMNDPRMESQEGLEGYPQITHKPFMSHDKPPNPFKPTNPERGSMSPMELERMMRELEESQRGYPSDMVEGDESQLNDFEPPQGTFGEEPMGNDFDAGRPQTIPMSPRGSVRGRGERQAVDKPKKPDWWRTLSGEE